MTRFLIIGFGRMGRIHYNAVKRISDADIAAVIDPTFDEGGVTEPVLKSFSDACEMAAFDACIIASPTKTHAHYGAECIKRRIPVLIEKPVARTLTEASQLEKLQNEHSTPVFVSFTERFHPVIQAALPELRKSIIREMAFTRIVQPSRNIISDGLLHDITVHDIDLVRFLTGKEIAGHSIREKSNEHGLQYEIQLSLENDIQVQIHSSTDNSQLIRRFTIQTEDSVFEGDLLAKTLVKKSGKSEFMIPVDSAMDAAQRQLEQFFQFNNNENLGHLATLDDGIKSLEIVEYQNGNKY